ncbi:MAG TPA: glycolate oxidase subunit GlcF [Xanthobacteraceae bacterium]|nr:glycolate oxidase subunit GlcF [Xanthobacteraceae bacterium]
MQTNFTLAQLADPDIQVADKILRACVHCGFCTATCPTYVLLGDELDSPRGRIYLIKEMLERNQPATADVVKHIDRCLSCLACMTTCPSGVHYMHLVDQARARIEETYRRPLLDRLYRAFLAKLMPYPARFRAALYAALLAKPFAPLFAAIGLKPIAAMLRLAPWRVPAASLSDKQRIFPAEGTRKGRVALLSGCVDRVTQPAIRAAAIRLLNRNGIEVVLAEGEACCGSLSHHMGREHEAFGFVKNNVDVWTREIEGAGLDAILITASGCGTTIKDYGFMLRTDPSYRDKAAKVSALAKDISEYLATLAPLPPVARRNVKVAYHSACSMQHGQKIDHEPKELLARAGFIVRDIPEGHLCCGSAGTYNMLQSEIAGRLLARKAANIEKTAPEVVATGNIGCITQISSGIAIPVVHTVELLDWATGGPLPERLQAAGFGAR